jgi:Holliday junction resolvase RusA-like endonuclease
MVVTAAPAQAIDLRFMGDPAPQGSKQITRWGGLREVSKKVEPWRAVVQYQSEQQYKGPVIDGPVSIDVVFVFVRAKTHWSTAKGRTDQLLPSAPLHHTKAPDLDKLVRGILDPLTTRCGGCVLKDDSQVVVLECSKRYAEANETTGALVRITPL